MMNNNMKHYKLNDMEMNEVVGGLDSVAILKAAEGLEKNTVFDEIDEKVSEAASTAWEVVKYVLFG